MQKSFFRRFLIPEFNPGSLLRVLLVVLVSVIIFTQVLVPLRIEGKSMEPTHKDGGFTFCWRVRYLFAEPVRGDVVAIRFAGRQVMLLKRIIALAEETVEFRNGALFINGEWVKEPYIRSPSDWNLAPRKVEPGKVYVVGDNRTVAMDRHQMGQVEVERIMGSVLW